MAQKRQQLAEASAHSSNEHLGEALACRAEANQLQGAALHAARQRAREARAICSSEHLDDTKGILWHTKNRRKYTSVVVMKNCEPFVFGPALAIDRRPARGWAVNANQIWSVPW